MLFNPIKILQYVADRIVNSIEKYVGKSFKLKYIIVISKHYKCDVNT